MIMKNQSNLRHRLNFLLLTYPHPAGAAFATYVSKLRIDIFVSLEIFVDWGMLFQNFECINDMANEGEQNCIICMVSKLTTKKSFE